jgi:hypothetical protein
VRGQQGMHIERPVRCKSCRHLRTHPVGERGTQKHCVGVLELNGNLQPLHLCVCVCVCVCACMCSFLGAEACVQASGGVDAGSGRA